MHVGEGESVGVVALLERHAKTRLAVAADHFNRDYKKGFQFLQVHLNIQHSFAFFLSWHLTPLCAAYA